MTTDNGYTLGELARLLDVELSGDPGIRVHGLATLANAGPDRLSFLSNPGYAAQLASTRAAAVIVHPDHADEAPCPCLLSPSPYVSYAQASQLFAALSAPPGDAAIDGTAVISSRASLGQQVSVGPHAVIEAGARIGDGCRIGAGCYIGVDSELGADCRLHPNATIYHDVRLGSRALLHSGVVIGADGFGFAFDGRRSVRIAQLGGVRIGDDLDLGAGSTIDRGAIEHTTLGHGVKIDNQVQIGHNCDIGDHTVICGCTAIAGSARIGRYCNIGGAVGIVGHIRISDRVTVSAMSLVSQSIERPGVYSSGTLLQDSRQWKKNAIRLSRLDDLNRRVQDLEKRYGHDPDDSPHSGNDV